MAEAFSKKLNDDVVEGFRLSPQQRRVWMLQRHSSSGSRARLLLKITGDLRKRELERSVRSLVERHEALRTSLYCHPGLKEALQVIHDEALIDWREYDLAELPQDRQTVRIDELQNNASSSSYNETDRSTQCVLMTLAPREHLLAVSLPSWSVDGRSVQNLIREIAKSYRSDSAPEEFTEEPAQYLQFSEWQNDLAEDEDIDIAKDYWNRRFSRAHLDQPVPFEIRPRTVSDFNPSSIRWPIDSARTTALTSVLNAMGFDLSTFLHACWCVLLWRHTRHADSTIGFVCDGRKYPELKEALGLFATCVPIRLRVDAESEFKEVMAQVRDETDGAEKWQEYWSWDRLAEIADTPESKTCYLPIAFEFAEYARSHSSDRLTLQLVDQKSITDPFKLRLSGVRWTGEVGLELELRFDRRFITEEAARCLASQFKELVVSASADLYRTAGSLNIVSDAERQSLLVERNRTHRDLGESRPFANLFEEQAERSPDRVSLVCDDQRLTYSEVNSRANQIASRLLELGVEPESPVGLWM